MENPNNPLLKLHSLGQSIWLDYLRRGMMSSGELKNFIDQDGLRGVTSNPSIFEKAIAGSHDYDETVRPLALEGKTPEEMYQILAIEDIQKAADLFRPIYDQEGGGDGFVSLEVSPYLAHDTKKTIDEARRLWSLVDRPNVMIKVPATVEGLPAIQQLISEGININITLLFGLPRYRKVVEAYLAGLEARAEKGQPVGQIASVASFFLSRIDVLVDPILEKKLEEGGDQAKTARDLHGQVAISSAKAAYMIYQEIFNSERFNKLTSLGAQKQRLLWASTSTKNPNYSDVKYVEALIGPETVNTLPLETINAYRDHGQPVARLMEGMEQAQNLLDQLPKVEIDLDQVTQQLEDDGVQKFSEAFDKLMEALKKRREAAIQEPLDRQVLYVDGSGKAVEAEIDHLKQENFCSRIWRKDATLWKQDPKDLDLIRNSLGWLHVAEKMEELLGGIEAFVSDIKAAGFRHVIHIGMGGSSLAPLVFERIFPTDVEGIPVTVLDTTDPATILRVERSSPIVNTLFIIASKSGTTAEPLGLGDYFYQKLVDAKMERAGDNFVAITDPGTPLVSLAQERGFRHIFKNFPDIGGRFSALSYFGLVPAALMGIDISELLAQALRMVHACATSVPSQENPGVILGAVLGRLQREGRDKVTLLMDGSISPLGLWIEQLLAESTGKEGTGLLPVAGEPLGSPDVYGKDRLFVYMHLDEKSGAAKVDGSKAEAIKDDALLKNGVQALKEANQPVVEIRLDNLLDLGQEFVRWEMATAAAGSILGINAFNQPNVQESKDNTNHLLDKVKEQGNLEEPEPNLVEGGLRLFYDNPAQTIHQTLENFFSQAKAGDYIALMAYLEETSQIDQSLQTIRLRLRDTLRLATTLGYGPRFLHSTGQFHKGGTNEGLFLQITGRDKEDASIPGKPYTFRTFKQAQALGDLQALKRHSRRALRVDLGTDVERGLMALGDAIGMAMEKLKDQGILQKTGQEPE